MAAAVSFVNGAAMLVLREALMVLTPLHMLALLPSLARMA